MLLVTIRWVFSNFRHYSWYFHQCLQLLNAIILALYQHYCKRTSFSKTFLFCVFWLIYILWFFSTFTLICLSTTPDSFKLHINTFNHLDILFNFIFWYFLALLQCFIVFQDLLMLSAHLLSYFLEVLAKHSGSLPIQSCYKISVWIDLD